MNDNEELNEALQKTHGRITDVKRCAEEASIPTCSKEIERDNRSVVQWTSGDGKIFIPSSKSQIKLPPGLYEIKSSNSIGVYFQIIKESIEGLIRFNETNSIKIAQEIETFWDRECLFRKFNLSFKRGVLLWGPPGSGKTCTIKIIMSDVIKRGGVIFKFTQPSLFAEGLRLFREIEPTTPCVVLMEDLDAILDQYNESSVINLLDGVDLVDKIVFLATTNYPERLGARIVNRPSRFDKRIKIGKPNEDSRKVYFEYLFSKDGEEISKHDICKWVKDTEGLSLAHLKELFVGIVVLGGKYEDVIETLKSMRDHLESRESVTGFK